MTCTILFSTQQQRLGKIYNMLKAVSCCSSRNTCVWQEIESKDIGTAEWWKACKCGSGCWRVSHQRTGLRFFGRSWPRSITSILWQSRCFTFISCFSTMCQYRPVNLSLQLLMWW